MSNFSNKTQVVLGAAYWLFGDWASGNEITGDELREIYAAVNHSSTPWSVQNDDENDKWVTYLYTNGKLDLADIADAVENDLNFSLHEKFQLIKVLVMAKNSRDWKFKGYDEQGWDALYTVMRELGVDVEDYNKYTEQ